MPSRKERTEKLHELLEQCYQHSTKSFAFNINGRGVCEIGYLQVLGILTQRRKPPNNWIHYKKWLLAGRPVENLAENESTSVKMFKDGRANKYLHGLSFINHVAQIFSDTVPTDGNKVCIPYETIDELFREYENYCNTCASHIATRCGLSTFRKAFRSVGDTVKMLGSKGTFQTCDICNCAHDLLRSRDTTFNKEQREIILKFKRLHLQQQAEERNYQEKNKLFARMNLERGQPSHAYILIDGMTKFTGNTPRTGKKFRQGKDSNIIGNRIIGVEVIFF